MARCFRRRHAQRGYGGEVRHHAGEHRRRLGARASERGCRRHRPALRTADQRRPARRHRGRQTAAAALAEPLQLGDARLGRAAAGPLRRQFQRPAADLPRRQVPNGSEPAGAFAPRNGPAAALDTAEAAGPDDRPRNVQPGVGRDPQEVLDPVCLHRFRRSRPAARHHEPARRQELRLFFKYRDHLVLLRHDQQR